MYSVLISIHAGEDASNLRQCLTSIVEQSRQPSQVVVVEDGPIGTDLTDVLNQMDSNLPILRIKLESNHGLGMALNIGVTHCVNDLIARMDADDIALPQRFAIQLRYMSENPDVDVVGTFARELLPNGEKGELITVPVTHEQIVEKVWTNPFIHPTVVFRKSSIERLGGYDRRLRTRQDYDLWFRCVAGGLTLQNIPIPLLLYRLKQPHKRKDRSLRVTLSQAIIGLRGCRLVGAPFYAHILVTTPLLVSFLPQPVAVWLRQVFRRTV